jgi:hypothetical protein
LLSPVAAAVTTYNTNIGENVPPVAAVASVSRATKAIAVVRDEDAARALGGVAVPLRAVRVAESSGQCWAVNEAACT